MNFATLISVLSGLACAEYAWRKDWAHSAYWFCGMSITLVVTYWLDKGAK